MATTTVLAIDGGGIRGLIPAAFLDALERAMGKPVFELFDYVAGTSTGGILALGLALDKPGETRPYTAAELVALYRDEGGAIFSRGFWHTVRSLGNFNGPKYPADGIEAVLQRFFAGRKLSDARTQVLVTAYALELRQPFFFRSWQAQAPATSLSHDYQAWDVARATSAAPTYFPPHRAPALDGQKYALIDGGMYANNPALCAWVEARDRHPDDEILVVSVGTGNPREEVKYDDARHWGLAGWAPHLVDIIFDGVSGTVDVELDEMLNTGDTGNHARFQVDLGPGQQELDDTSASNLEALRALGAALAEGAPFQQLCARLARLASARQIT